METYRIFVIPMGDAIITQEIEFHSRAPVIKYQAREYLDYKKAPKNSIAPSNNTEKSKKDFVAQNYKIDKTTK